MPRPLTATEEIIIQNLRDGLRDAEIAVRLSLTVGDVKRRITVILHDFRLTDRAELLAWTPPEPGESEEEAAEDVTPEAAEARTPVLSLVLTAFVLLLGAAVLLVLKPWTNDTPGPDQAVVQPPATENALPAPTSVPRPASTPVDIGPRPEGVDFGQAVQIDTTFALLLSAEDADGNLVGLDRIFRHPGGGDALREALWRPPDGATVIGMVTGQRGSVAISYREGVSTRLTTSRDGGVTWTAPLDVESGSRPILAGSFGAVLASAARATGYRLYDQKTVRSLTPPQGAVQEAPVGAGPNDELLWHAGGGALIDAAGTLVTQIDTQRRPVDSVSSLTWLAGYGHGLAAWRSGDEDYSTVLRTADDDSRTFTGTPGIMEGGTGVGFYVGNYCYYVVDGEASRTPCIPVLLRPADSTVYPINDPLLSVNGFDQQGVVGSLPGPFALVRPGSACAPIYISLHESPGECAAPGTLLSLTHFASMGGRGPEMPAHAVFNDEYYVRVRDSTGENAWVATKFVDTGFPPPINPAPSP